MHVCMHVHRCVDTSKGLWIRRPGTGIGCLPIFFHALFIKTDPEYRVHWFGYSSGDSCLCLLNTGVMVGCHIMWVMGTLTPVCTPLQQPHCLLSHLPSLLCLFVFWAGILHSLGWPETHNIDQMAFHLQWLLSLCFIRSGIIGVPFYRLLI